MPNAVPADIDAAALAGKPVPACRRTSTARRRAAPAFHMGTRPQTLVGLADSPIALATFMIDHDAPRLYWENKVPFFAPKNVTIPVAVSAFPDELYQLPRSWAERAYPKLIHYSKHDKGGHFAAWEQPAPLTDDLRVAFRSLRQ